ncbi:uncharacterized protein K441DRAFT_571236, partial [Cenococcum geophilum 1.58]|uniref:uncharacterized protein n=1 Tax=Cenococcum geophilum 1.58 TaxID=794803 RepID=UPI00358E7072
GLKPIHSLIYYPLKYHPNVEEEKQELANSGYKLILLMGIRHQQYKGKAFYIEKGKPIRLSINSWIIVNPVLF